MHRPTVYASAAALAVLASPALLPGQSGGRVAFQAGATAVAFHGAQVDGIEAGSGIEVQAGLRLGRLWLGGGIQATRHGVASGSNALTLREPFGELRRHTDPWRWGLEPYVALRAGLAEMRVTTGEGRVTTEGPRFGSSVGAVRQLGGRFWVDGAFGYSLVLFNDRHVDGAREPNSEALSGLWSARLALRYTAGH